MASSYGVSPMLQSPSSDLTPQDLLMAANQDPQAVLHYIVSLESEVNRLQHQFYISREEMFTVIQISMSAVASEMSKTLNVTKNSLVDIQDKFRRIAMNRAEGPGAIRPGVMKHYQGEKPDTPATGDKKDSAATLFNDIFGGGKGKQSSHYSPHIGQSGGSSLPLNPDAKTNLVHYTPTKIVTGSKLMLDPFNAQDSTVFSSAGAKKTYQHGPRFTFVEASPTLSGLPSYRSIDVQSPKHTDIRVVAPAPPLAVRSESQQNVGKIDSRSSTEAFMAYMEYSHKQRRNYRSTPQPKIVAVASTDSFVTDAEESGGANKIAVTKSRLTQPVGPLIKYDVNFLKKIGISCKNQPNPFLGNKDEELKPVLEWNRHAKPLKQPARHISQAGGRAKTFI